jgi:hypothetical protein
VEVFKIEPATGERLGLLATATVGEAGWVDLPQPIIVRAGEAFIAVSEQEE